MDWLSAEHWAGLAVIVTVIIGVPTYLANRRSTHIAAEEQAARRERDRLAEPPIPSPPPPEPEPVWPAFTNLPPDLDREIIGRDALVSALDDALRHGTAAALTPAAALHGMGGVGKTSLARLYARERRTRFEGVWWLPSEQVEETLVPAIDALGRAIGAEVEGDAAARAPAIWAALAQRGAPWLLIFDNAPDYATVRPWLAHGESVRMLVTSRRDDFPPDRMPTLAVDRLPREHAADLLEREAQRQGDRDGALTLADALGGLPLALVVAAAYARETGMAFADLAGRIDALCEASPPADYPASIAASLELTLARVEADSDTGPDEMALLRLLPWLAPEGIDAKLVLDIVDGHFAKHPDFIRDMPAELIPLAADAVRLHRAITRLGERALAIVSPAADGAARMAALHRVTALVLRRRLAGDAAALRRGAAAVVEAMYLFRVDDAHNPKHWPRFNRLNPHIHTLATEPPPTKSMCNLLLVSGAYSAINADFEKAITYTNLAVEIVEKFLQNDLNLKGSCYACLGEICRLNGRDAASEAAFRRAKVIADELGFFHRHWGEAQGNLALALKQIARKKSSAQNQDRRFKRLSEALDLEKAALSHAKQVTEPKIADRQTARIFNNISETYLMMNRIEEAQSSCLSSLEICRKFASNDPRRAFAARQLARTYLRSREPDKAVPVLREALCVFEDAFPDEPGKPQHRRRLDTARQLATCLFALDPPETAEAEALCARYGLDPAERRARAAAIIAGHGA